MKQKKNMMSLPGTLHIGSNRYDVPRGASVLGLYGNKVVDVETFRVCFTEMTASSSPSPNSGLIGIPMHVATIFSTEGGCDDDTRSFGAAIAGSLTEERMALCRAFRELTDANATAAASVNALTAVYGPQVAAAKEDSVIELNARGAKLTTLLYAPLFRHAPTPRWLLSSTRTSVRQPGRTIGSKGVRRPWIAVLSCAPRSWTFCG